MAETSNSNNSNISEHASARQKPDEILKEIYSKGGYGSPEKIGRVMRIIRDLRPLTEAEWRQSYLETVHDETDLLNLAGEMFRDVPKAAPVTMRHTLDFIENMIFSVSFRGYDKQKTALRFLGELLNPPGGDCIREAPLDWRERYDVEFYVVLDGKIAGLRLRPAAENQKENDPMWNREKREAFEKKYGRCETVFYARTPDGFAPCTENREEEKWLRLRTAIKLEHLKNAGDSKDRIVLDLAKLNEEILKRKDEQEKASFPFITRHADGALDISWFTYGIREEGEKKNSRRIVCVRSIFTVGPAGCVSHISAPGLEIPHGKQTQQSISYSGYIEQLRDLYEDGYTPNKMNSILWESASKPLYDSYLKVIAYLREQDEALPAPALFTTVH